MPVLCSFSHATAGLGHVLRTQRNFRIEVATGAIAIALVLILEAANTALEHAVTLASPNVDPRAKAAKDVAAAAVLIAALTSIAIGALLFLPRLTAMLAG